MTSLILPPVHYVADGQDRLVARRRDDAWFAERLLDPATRLVPVWRSHSLVADEADPRPVTPPGGVIPLEKIRSASLLGLHEGAVHIGVDVSGIDDPAVDADLAALGRFLDLRRMGWLLPRPEAALMVQARAFAWWHGQSLFCGRCGRPTEAVEAGTSRRCTDAGCAAQVFPRMDPAVIVLVTDPTADRVLLGRQTIWPSGMRSVLAGFVEAGENFETTVRREVFEESGIRVGDVRYAASQPWPFPQSLMVAFTARALNTDIVVDGEELAEAAWYDRDFLVSVRNAVPGVDPFALPTQHSVARWLLDGWLEGWLKP